ncbi:Transcription initiation factor TFIID subunit 12 [Toxocara canis]|uniref:Transcription initiation factor TFIID subunit 12 n=1 Tax=Toxocara canis TaxID=6265 RepID=A0A0B2V8W2_TOXCA|nr:Transcription initiation factor TFIID subunit 12 [Toxocara canis]
MDGRLLTTFRIVTVMAEYSGQQVSQGYGVADMGQSPATMQRMQAQHPSPQQQHTHMLQGAQIMTQVPQQPVMTQVPQQPVMAQVPQQQVMSQVPQQQIMMQSNQPMQMPACTSMSIQGTNMSIYQMAPQMGISSMMPQQNVTLMNQSAQMQQQGSNQGQLVQGGDQMLAAPPSQQQQQAQQTSQANMITSGMGQPPIMTAIGQQPQQHQIMQPGPQMMQHQSPINSQQQQQQQQQMVQNHSPGGFASHLPQTRPSSTNYQQAPPLHRMPAPRYPTPSPESAPHNPNIYRPAMQRTPMTPRLMGQSSAIRQALGHLPSTSSAPCMSINSGGLNTPSGNSRILEKDALEAFIKSVDPMETVEEDVSEALIQLVDEFVNDLIDQSARVAKHRNSPKLEGKDVQFVLEKRLHLFATPDSSQFGHTVEHNPYAKSPGAEAHRQRMALIKKFIQKP